MNHTREGSASGRWSMGKGREKAEEATRMEELLAYERGLWSAGIVPVAGVDEAGRGPLAGPVVAAAVVFAPGTYIPGVDDSKRLSAEARQRLYPEIFRHAAALAIGVVQPAEIDRLNIRNATHLAMRKALSRLTVRPAHVLVDGEALPGLDIPQTALVGGDGRCFSVAAASIVAKVVRDRLMIAYDRLFPEYGFAEHKGYGTVRHIAAIRTHGLCPIHRRSFRVRELRRNE
ncbi:MAG: ribonuclease HII [candidate division KSB1 bacterium]|nr:ribonuclease HII [candidate division KSB1 bacterium]